jgi:hypothetical protein
VLSGLRLRNRPSTHVRSCWPPQLTTYAPQTQDLQDKHDELEKAFFKEKRELEAKYAALYSE